MYFLHPFLYYVVHSKKPTHPLSMYFANLSFFFFQIILWELLTCSIPFDEYPFCKWPAQLEDSIISGTRPTIPSACIPSYKKVWVFLEGEVLREEKAKHLSNYLWQLSIVLTFW